MNGFAFVIMVQDITAANQPGDLPCPAVLTDSGALCQVPECCD